MEQNFLLSKEDYTKSRNFWEKYLSEDLEELMLINQNIRVEEKKIGSVTYSLPVGVAEKVFGICNNTDTLIFVFLLTAFKIFLQKITNQKNITIATPSMGESNIINRCLLLKSQVQNENSFHETLLKIKDNVASLVSNQFFPIEEIFDENELGNERNSLYKVIFLMESVTKNFIVTEDEFPGNDLIVRIQTGSNKIDCLVEYNSNAYDESVITKYMEQYAFIMEQVVGNPKMDIGDIVIISEKESNLIINKFNQGFSNDIEFKSVIETFNDKVVNNSLAIAAEYNGLQITYDQLNKDAERIALYLKNVGIKKEDRIAIVLSNPHFQINAILGVLKSGAAYVPIEGSCPLERMNKIMLDSNVKLVIFEKKYLREINRIQQQVEGIERIFCLDSNNVLEEEEATKSNLMDQELWHVIGRNATDDITGGGWFSSYTGEPFSKKEMEEFANNIYFKVKPYLKKTSKVLEIGCATGYSMYKIAPEVELYYGTDISEVIIDENKNKPEYKNADNIKLKCISAHEVGQVEDKDFDIVIINSVIQGFHGYNYLRKVIKECISKINNNGIIFLGDIMDLDLKESLLDSLKRFKDNDVEGQYSTYLDFSEELFLNRSFLNDLKIEITEIEDVKFSKKIFTVENELTKYRFDSLIHINKNSKESGSAQKLKHQDDCSIYEGLNYELESKSEQIAPGDLAYILYTSGSTGEPKGVLIEHASLSNFFDWRNKKYEYTPNDIFIQAISFSFDAYGTNLYSSVLSGSRLILVSEEHKLDAFRLSDAILKKGVTTLSIVPTVFKEILNISKGNDILINMKSIIFGGDNIDENLINTIENENTSVKLINEYGPTEATIGSISNINYSTKTPNNIGCPINNLSVYICDRNLNLLPVGIPGEIVISGIGIARGYTNVLENESKFVTISFNNKERAYRTGDIGKWNADGTIQFLGRLDHQIKVKGYRIETKEIEKNLSNFYKLQDCVVTVKGIENGANEKRIVAYYVLKPNVKTVSESEFKNYLISYFPQYMIPESYIKIDKIPLKSNGKVNLDSLPDPCFKLEQEYIAPQSNSEKCIVDIWSEILDIDKNQISVNSNFFDLGGNSIKAVQLMNKMKIKWPIVSVTDIFNHHTVKKLAVFVDESDNISTTDNSGDKEVVDSSLIEKRKSNRLRQMNKRIIQNNDNGRL